MTQFTHEPFIGPLPLRFGMSAEEVTRLIGVPREILPCTIFSRSELRSGISLGYSRDTGFLEEVVIFEHELFFDGFDLLKIDDTIQFLRKYDDSPKYSVGSIFFLKLGLSLSGFCDPEEGGRSITSGPKGHWDEFLEDFVPFE
jgi:hypothetical protein